MSCKKTIRILRFFAAILFGSNPPPAAITALILPLSSSIFPLCSKCSPPVQAASVQVDGRGRTEKNKKHNGPNIFKDTKP